MTTPVQSLTLQESIKLAMEFAGVKGGLIRYRDYDFSFEERSTAPSNVYIQYHKDWMETIKLWKKVHAALLDYCIGECHGEIGKMRYAMKIKERVHHEIDTGEPANCFSIIIEAILWLQQQKSEKK